MLIDEKVKKLLEENPVSLATVDSDGNSNVIGVASVKVVDNDRLLITDNFMNQTKKNLGVDNRTCLAVWNKDGVGYKFIGKAEYFSDGDWHRRVKEIPENKSFPVKGAVLVSVSRVIPLK